MVTRKRRTRRIRERGRDPRRRPADAVPLEFVLMAYPILDLPPLPEGGDDETVDEMASDD